MLKNGRQGTEVVNTLSFSDVYTNFYREILLSEIKQPKMMVKAYIWMN